VKQMEFYPEGCCEKLGKTFASIDEIKNAMIKNEIIEGKVLLCDREHNLHIDLGVIRGIIKREEGAIGIDDGTVRDIALISKVGKSICFNIIGFERDVFGNTFAVLSRKSVQEKCKKEFLDNLKNGDVIDAKVTHLEKFGAFIDIGAGINSLIPIDMLSVSRISHPKQRLTEGQKIKVALRKREGDKLTFTLKELLGSWEENADLFTPGETVTGVIRSIEDYGVFVELMPNLAGLAEIDDNLFEGQSVAVYIKSIIKQKMKIKLIIVEAYEQENTAKDLVYFNQSNHIDYWQYSPKDCPKIIKTDFNE
jgi:hypothetical protein